MKRSGEREEAAMLGAKAVARAKINLFLEVGARRDDGYHDIRSVMQSLELSDELYFRRTDGSAGRIVIRCNDAGVPSDEGNLVFKAIEAFEDRAGFTASGVEVLINKRIPAGAGLAGGSADAAAALVAMNHMFEMEMPLDVLADIGAGVGSDVPFCIQGGTALVSGRGEIVERLEPLPPFQLVLASSGEEVSTREVYERFDSLLSGLQGKGDEGTEHTFDALMEGIKKHDFERIYSNLHNSLESATIAVDRIEQYKRVARGAGASAALMTGSGPTVFALVSGMEQAAEVAWELEKAAPITIVTSFAGRGAEISAV